MSTRRSRSPRRDLATTSAASGLLRALDVEKMQLQLGGGCTSKVLYFADDDIWFEAKPLVLYLDYSPTNVTHTLGLVKDKNKKSLRELLEAKGSPKWVDLSTPGHNDLKASYINEPGLYSLIFKSTKPQAQDFQDWVYEEVLTALRRRGSYSLEEERSASACSSGVQFGRAIQVEVQREFPVPQSREQPIKRQRRGIQALDEARLDWKKDLGVAPQDLPGIKPLFKAYVLAEIRKECLPAADLGNVDRWTRTPPLRLEPLARAAVSAYLALISPGALSAGSDEVPSEAPEGNASEGNALEGSFTEEAGLESRDDGSGDTMLQPAEQQLLSDSEDEDDVLKVSEVMRAAGACGAVYLAYRSDLSNQMLALKSVETQGAFSERRPEVVRGGVQVSVHKYRKSRDWPLAWRAVQKTQRLYQKRIRECLEKIYRAAGGVVPDAGISELARRVAAALRTQ